MRYLKERMVLSSIVVLISEISFLSNTSNPSRNGTRTRLSFSKSGFFSDSITSVISNLAALLPISMAAKIMGLGFKCVPSGQPAEEGQFPVVQASCLFFDSDIDKFQSGNELSWIDLFCNDSADSRQAILPLHCLKAGSARFLLTHS